MNDIAKNQINSCVYWYMRQIGYYILLAAFIRHRHVQKNCITDLKNDTAPKFGIISETKNPHRF